jgi:choline dehydrogenase
MERAIECDVAVIGGGSAGCVVAGRLAAESSAEIVLLEAGPDYGAQADGRWPADLLDGGALATSHSWGYTSGDLYPGRDPIEFQRARVIGGSSSHNGCIAAVGCPEDYDGWAALTGDAGWSAEAIRPLIARALHRLRVRDYDDAEIGPYHRACIAAATTLGVPRAHDLADLDGSVGFGAEPVNVEHGTRVNAAFAYLDPARGRPNLRVLDNVLCDRLRFGGNEVEVVGQRQGGEIRVRAGRVVLAAGTYGSPAVLLRSGVGDADELGTLGIEPVHALPGVGANLHDHPLVEIDFAGSDELRELLRDAAEVGFVPEEQSIGKLRSSHSTGPYDLHLMPVAGLEHSLFAGRVLIGAAALEPRSRGRLQIRSVDPEVAPLLDHGFLSDPDGDDLAVLVEGVAMLRELAAEPILRSLIGPEISPGSDADLTAAIRRTHGHYFHPVGTCAMGKASDPSAVCNGEGAVHGLDRVVVADCSLMPVVPRANTNIPAVVVGERIADVLLGARPARSGSESD